MARKKLFKMLTKRSILKTGAIVTTAAAGGSALGAAAFGIPGERIKSAKSAAIQGASVGVAGTAAVLGRRQIGRFLKGGLKELVGFRKIRGRIVPIFKKKKRR